VKGRERRETEKRGRRERGGGERDHRGASYRARKENVKDVNFVPPSTRGLVRHSLPVRSPTAKRNPSMGRLSQDNGVLFLEWGGGRGLVGLLFPRWICRSGPPRLPGVTQAALGPPTLPLDAAIGPYF